MPLFDAQDRPVQVNPYGLTRRDHLLLVGLVLGLCLFPMLLPGDAPWINDEPVLIQQALDANRAQKLPARGLFGSQGWAYGPLPTWFYQGLLCITHNPVAMVAIRAGLVSLATGLSLLWLARTLRLWPWFVPVILLSPYLWAYSRQLWDNSFTIPLAALAMAAYAAFLEHRRTWTLAVALACIIALPLVHLMALAMSVPLLLHLLILQRRSLWPHRKAVLAAMVMAPAVFVYVRDLLESAPGTAGAETFSPSAIWFALLAPRLLSASGLDYILGSNWARPGGPMLAAAIFAAARIITLVAYPLVWMGMLLAARRAARVVRSGASATTFDHVAAISLTVWAAQTALDIVRNVHGHPHYYNATWIVYAIFAWLTIDALARRHIAHWLAAVQAASLATVLLFLLLRIHLGGGMRSRNYGPTLANQVQVVRMLNEYSPDSPVKIEAQHYRDFPHALSTLRALLPPSPHEDLPRAALRLRERHPTSDDARLEVVKE